MKYRIPTLEQIYDEYYKDSFYAAKGFYPRSIKNFDRVMTPEKVELLTRFQNMLKRNVDMIDWKKYIKACAQYFKRNFDLGLLGSLKANKIYRTYVNYDNSDRNDEDIKNDIINSLKFIKMFCTENDMTMKEYFYDRSTNLPVILKHIYSGAVSAYFYAVLSDQDMFTLMR